MSKMKSKPLPRMIGDLKPHPKQAEFFGDLPEAQFDALVADLKKHGQRTPIDILPDGTIITGHQRVRAARRLGWEEVEVVVRHDLAEAGEDAVEELFITDNSIRRHLSPLSRARCARRLLELKADCNPGQLRWADHDRMKAEVGKQLGICSRSVNRYLRALEAPPAVQRAFDREEIGLVDVGKVVGLPSALQRETARRIHQGEDASEVLADVLKRSKPQKDEARAAVRQLTSALRRVAPQLQPIAHLIDPRWCSHDEELYQTASALLSEILSRIDASRDERLREQQESDARIAESFRRLGLPALPDWAQG
jgi:ParB-like chromosome segregation protein Spo0J